MEPDGLSAIAGLGSAGVALAALIVAIVAARAALRTLDLQRKQFAAAEARAEREQASKVTFLLTGRGMSEPEDNDDGTVSVRVQGHDSASLLNASESPVFLLIVYERYRTKKQYRIRILAELENLMPTGGTAVDCEFGQPASWPVSDCRLYFRDAAGVEWVRAAGGNLRRVPDNELTDVMQALAEHHGALDPEGDDDPGPVREITFPDERDRPSVQWPPAGDDQADNPPDRSGSGSTS